MIWHHNVYFGVVTFIWIHYLYFNSYCAIHYTIIKQLELSVYMCVPQVSALGPLLFIIKCWHIGTLRMVYIQEHLLNIISRLHCMCSTEIWTKRKTISVSTIYLNKSWIWSRIFMFPSTDKAHTVMSPFYVTADSVPIKLLKGCWQLYSLELVSFFVRLMLNKNKEDSYGHISLWSPYVRVEKKS